MRPLSGPFGREEDLALLKELDKTLSDNSKKRRGRLAWGLLLFITFAVLPVLFYMLWYMGTSMDLDLAAPRFILIVLLTVLFVGAFPLELSSERPDLMESLIRRFSREWGYDKELMKELHSVNEMPRYLQTNRENILILAPIHRESIVEHHYRTSLKSTLSSYLMFAVIGPAMFLIFAHQLVYIATASLVAIPSLWSVFHIVLNFKYNFATRLDPRQWYVLRKAVMWGVAALGVAVAAVFISAFVQAWSYSGGVRLLQENPFLMVLLSVPGALTDLILLENLSYSSVMIPILLWVAGYLSFRQLQRTDVMRASVKLHFMGRFGKKDLEWAPSPEVAAAAAIIGKKETRTGPVRSQRVDWSRIDLGPGPEVIRSKARLYEHNAPVRIVVVLVVLSILVLTGIVGAMLNSEPDLTDSTLMVGPIVVFLLASFFAVRIGRDESERPDILRMLPLGAKEVLKAMMDPVLKYSLAPYFIMIAAVCLVLRIADLAFLLGVLVLVPALTLAFSPLICQGYAIPSFEGSAAGGLIAAGLILTGVWLGLANAVFAVPLWVLIALGGIAAGLCFGISWRFFIARYSKLYIRRPGWRSRRLAAFLAVTLLLSVAGAVPAGLVYSGIVHTSLSPEKIAWVVPGDFSVVNTTVEYDGSVIVPRGSSLEIMNSTVRFKVAMLGETKLLVNGGGSLTVINSTLTADTYFEFVIYGTATISGSIVRRTWGSEEDAGIQVKSDNVTIRRTTVEDGLSHGIYVEDGAAVIEDCVIQRNQGAGLLLSESHSIIKNNIIRENRQGVYVWPSFDYLQNNTIQNNSRSGMVLDDASPSLVYNRFYDNGGYGIIIYGETRSALEDNFFANNTRGIMGHGTSSNSMFILAVYCGSSTFIVLLPFIWLDHKRTHSFRNLKSASEL